MDRSIEDLPHSEVTEGRRPRLVTQNALDDLWMKENFKIPVCLRAVPDVPGSDLYRGAFKGRA